jgi:glycosyltransferase involved in cell wall biosynthesis
VLVRALARAQERVDAPLRLLFVGSGPERASLEQQAARAGVEATFVGHLDGDDLLDAYLAGDVFALLSRREPWGVVVNEAAACGLPLVLSDHVGAAYDLVEEGRNGVIVPVEDAEAPAEAIARLAGDRELRHAWGSRSRELASGWTHAASAEAFADAVRLAVTSAGR